MNEMRIEIGRMSIGALLALAVGCTAEPAPGGLLVEHAGDDGPAERWVSIEPFGPRFELLLDAFHAVPAPEVAREDFVVLVPQTEEIRASIAVRDVEGRLAASLDTLTALAGVTPVLDLDVEGAAEPLSIAGVALLSQVSFPLEGVTLPQGASVRATVRFDDHPIGGAEALYSLSPGDANADGAYTSADYVTVFQAGLYETGAPATFATGDWNGDGVFSTSDLVHAQTRGHYERPAPPMPRAPAFVRRDRVPGWFLGEQTVEALEEQIDALEDERVEADSDQARDEIDDRIDELQDLVEDILASDSSDPDSDYNRVDMDRFHGCGVICWMAARAQHGTVWDQRRDTSGTCDLYNENDGWGHWHDEDCLDRSQHELPHPYPLECPSDDPRIQSLWQDGPRYQFTECAAEESHLGDGQVDVTASCAQSVRMELFCETFGAGCAAMEPDAGRCDYTETRHGEASAFASYHRTPDSGLPVSVQLDARLLLEQTEATDISLSLSPTGFDVQNLGVHLEPGGDDVDCPDFTSNTSLRAELGIECSLKFISKNVPTAETECKVYVRGRIIGSLTLQEAAACFRDFWNEGADSNEMGASGRVEGLPRPFTVDPATGRIVDDEGHRRTSQSLGILGLSVDNRTNARSRVFERLIPGHHGVPSRRVPEEQHAGGEASLTASVQSVLRQTGESRDMLCMTGRPWGRERNELQDIFFEYGRGSAQLGDWWGSSLTLGCGGIGELFVIAEDVPAR